MSLFGFFENKCKREIYPIGSIYLSVTATNPREYFGGVWAQFGKGCAIVGVDPDDAEFRPAERTGGSKTHKLHHTELPTHVHTIQAKGASISKYPFQSGSSKTASGTETCLPVGTGRVSISALETIRTYKNEPFNLAESQLTDQPHNNLQPYITCYMWKRVS